MPNIYITTCCELIVKIFQFSLNSNFAADINLLWNSHRNSATMNITTDVTNKIMNSAENTLCNMIVRKPSVEWQIIVLFTIHGIGCIANILNHIVLCKGFSDTIMLRLVKCINTVDTTYCVIKIMSTIFMWWNYVPHKWLVEMRYYVVLYGSFSLIAILALMFVLLAIDRINAANRQTEQYAQKYSQNTKTKIVFYMSIGAAVMIGLVCSLPLFYVFKIREVCHNGNFVYTITYVKPEPKPPCTDCITYLVDKVNVETFYMITKVVIPRALLCMCLIVFLFKLPNIIGHYRYIKSKCEQKNNESASVEDCVSDISLVPAILIIIVVFSVLICTSSVIRYLNYEKIINRPTGKTMRRVVNMLLNMPIILCCATKPFIYLVFSSRYRANFRDLFKINQRVASYSVTAYPAD